MTTAPAKTAGICPLHAEVHGDPNAPCIVLLQGLGMAITDWPADLIQLLAKNFHVVCIDNRDAGRSFRYGPDIDAAAVEMLEGNAALSTPPYTLFDMRDDVLRCLNALDIERFALLGFSMGGMIAQLVAAASGELVTGLIQVCSSGGEAKLPTTNSGWERILRTAQPFTSERALLEWLAEDLIWWSVPMAPHRSDARNAAQATLTGGFTQGGYARQLLALSRSGDRQAVLANISAPTLIIGGAQDRCISPASSQRAHGLIRNSELVLIESMGHSVDQGAIDAIDRWLGSLAVCQSDYRSTSARGRT